MRERAVASTSMQTAAAEGASEHAASLRPPSVSKRSLPIFRAVVALLAVGGGVVLAYHYPIAPSLALALFLLWTAISYRWPSAWLVVIPALLPISGLATWTGWFAFEELDLLVLGAAAGGYARLAWGKPYLSGPENTSPARFSRPATVLVTLFAFSCLLGLYRGIADAGGFVFDWYGSYESSMNSVRLCKSILLALLLLPLLQSAFRVDEQGAVQRLGAGLALGMAGAALAAVWERAAFTDLINFSTDYRTTALFWEMHVGGAAFDGFLALTFPFVIWELRRRQDLVHLAMALGLAALAAYACLTTFSRDVYIAIPAGLIVLGLLLAAQRRAAGGSSLHIVAWQGGIVALIGIAAFYLVFREGGYRALLAFLATCAVALTFEPAQRQTTFAKWAMSVGAGLLVGLLTALIAAQVFKGPYFMFAFAFGCNVALLVWNHRRSRTINPSVQWAGFVWLAVAAAAVALHWGGAGALLDSSVALVALVATVIGSSISTASWLRTDIRTRVTWWGMASLLAAGVAVFAGGAYMSDRFSTSSEDLDARFRHWKDGIGFMEGTAEWTLGTGLGRFPASYFFEAPERAVPGSYSLRQGGGERYLSLAGPRYPTSWGDLFRIAQRVSVLPGAYEASLDLRSTQDVELHLEVCEQNLLYNGACAVSNISVEGGPAWQRVTAVMDGPSLSGGPWYAPRLAFFAVAVASSRQSVDIRDIRLTGPTGTDLLANGDFADGMARWIPISERVHLPWHIKNLALDLLFDQGILGLAAFAMLLFAALWRLAFGAARRHPVAPYLAASMVGFVAVGAFDSLLDVPRVAFLFYLILLVGLSIRSRSVDIRATECRRSTVSFGHRSISGDRRLDSSTDEADLA